MSGDVRRGNKFFTFLIPSKIQFNRDYALGNENRDEKYGSDFGAKK